MVTKSLTRTPKYVFSMPPSIMQAGHTHNKMNAIRVTIKGRIAGFIVTDYSLVVSGVKSVVR
jgi:hypothetical protein